MPHDPVTASRIHLLAQTVLSQPFYIVLRAPIAFIKCRQLDEWDMDRLHLEVKTFKTEMFAKGFIVENYSLYLQPSGHVAIDGFENFPFKMLRSDGSWYPQEFTN